MDVALQDAPGVVLPYNLITDIGGPVDPNEVNDVAYLTGADPENVTPYSFPVIWFTLNNVLDTQASVEDQAAAAMTFNRMGVMGGPLSNPPFEGGGPNVGGVITLLLYQTIIGSGVSVSTLVQTTVDLTNAVPGHFYWSDPLPNSFKLWGSMISGPTTPVVNYVYTVGMASKLGYTFYANRPCTLRNGNTWGSVANGFYPSNDHLCHGGVDLNSTNYVDLGAASIQPDVAFSGQIQRRNQLYPSPFSPQVQLMGQPRRVGVFDPVNMAVKPILHASSMAGGPLWKPSKLCTG